MSTDNGNQTCQNEKTPTEREERSSVVCEYNITYYLSLYSDSCINKSQGRYLMFAMEGGEIYTASVVDNINMIYE